MRVNKDILIVVLLLIAFVVGGIMLGGGQPPESRQAGRELTPDPSVYNDRASGSRALFDWVRAQGYTPRVWRQNWENLDTSRAPVLLAIDPRVSMDFAPLTGSSTDDSNDSDRTILTAYDWPVLKQWLASGHTAVILSSRLPTGHTAGMTDGKDTFADAADIIIETATNGTKQDFSPCQPVPDTENIISVRSVADARIRSQMPSGVTLFGDKSGPLAIHRAVGRGRLIVIADARFASNGNLAQADNAAFLANILAWSAKPGQVILFDEYHHGESESVARTTIWASLGRPFQLGLIQLLFAFFAVVGVLAVRFGTPTPLRRGVQRTSAEYVTSVAGLYHRAHASTAALETLYRQFLRDVGARVGIAPDANLEQLASVVARRGHTDKEGLRHVLSICELRLDEGKISESELLDVVRRMERIRKDIGIA